MLPILCPAVLTRPGGSGPKRSSGSVGGSQGRMDMESTKKLSETTNMLRIIAEAWLKTHSEYLCMVDGKKTRIIK